MPSKGRLIKTQAARNFDQMIWRYKLTNFHNIELVKSKLGEIIDAGNFLAAHFVFCFPESRLFTKKNELKKIDSTNRLKSAEDAVSKILEIDDKYFVQTTAERIIACKSSNAEGYFHVTFQTINKMRGEQSILNFLISPQP